MGESGQRSEATRSPQGSADSPQRNRRSRPDRVCSYEGQLGRCRTKTEFTETGRFLTRRKCVFGLLASASCSFGFFRRLDSKSPHGLPAPVRVDSLEPGTQRSNDGSIDLLAAYANWISRRIQTGNCCGFIVEDA